MSRLISPLSPVPCTPTNISVSVDCSQDTARFNWTTSIGAIFYIAVAEDANGNVHSCNSMGTNCLMEDLRCGQNYTASIIGTNLKCNSTASEEVTFMTGRSEGWVTLKLDRFMIVSLGRRERDTRFVLTKLWIFISYFLQTYVDLPESDPHCLNPLPLYQLLVLQPTLRHSETVTPTML